MVGVGANSMDFVYRLPAYPTPAGPLSKLRIHTHERSPGGQTATALSACAALGLRTAYVGTISNDSNGALVRDTLVRRRIDVSRARARAGANPYAVILVADEERHQERGAGSRRESYGLGRPNHMLTRSTPRPKMSSMPCRRAARAARRPPVATARILVRNDRADKPEHGRLREP